MLLVHLITEEALEGLYPMPYAIIFDVLINDKGLRLPSQCFFMVKPL